MKNKSPVEGKNSLRFKFVFPDDYNPTYANGVWGGVSPTGEFSLHFFHERSPLPHNAYATVDDSGALVGDIGVESDEQLVIRYVTGGVTLPYGAAKSIYEWLGGKISEFEKATGLISDSGGSDGV